MSHEIIVVGDDPLDDAVSRVLAAAGFRIHRTPHPPPAIAVVRPDPPASLAGVDIDREARIVRVHGRRVELTRTEYDLLLTLYDRPRRVLTRAEIIDRVWGAAYDERIVDGPASRLRSKILNAGGPRLCVAVRGVGYRLLDA